MSCILSFLFLNIHWDWMGKALIYLLNQASISWAPIVCTEPGKKLCWFVFFSDLNFKSKGQVKSLDYFINIWKMNFEGNIKLLLHSLKYKVILSTYHNFVPMEWLNYQNAWTPDLPILFDGGQGLQKASALVLLASKDNLKGNLE